MSGTAAAVGALVWRSPAPVRAVSLAAAAGAAGAAGFTLVQAGPKQNSTGTVDLTMTVGSSLGSMLVATIVSSDAATPLPRRRGGGWQRRCRAPRPRAA